MDRHLKRNVNNLGLALNTRFCNFNTYPLPNELMDIAATRLLIN
jgi:hypothetical protein